MRLCRSSLITKLLILAVMAFAVITIVSIQPKISALQAERDTLAEEVNAMQQENLELEQDIDSLGSEESVRDLARERLNMVADGEIVYIDISK